ncbi:MAG: insulinase family protein [Devosiaceae bacterium]|nr:insulinase family protein [Devosiaceae bacterium MH13]
MVFAPSASEFTLDNGMRVVVIPDRRAPVVTHMIWYKVGAADEAPGESGIAHFLEHLMFKGTEANPGDTFSQTIAQLGGTQNAFTSYDYTAYFQRIAVEHLPLMMQMEADRMKNLVLSDDVVSSERNVVLEERASRVDNDPSAQMRETYAATFFQNHPYGVPIIGWRHEIEDLSREDALAFYARYYTPENAILVVAGDVDEDAVRGLAETHYGVIPPRDGAVTDRRRPREPEPVAERRVELRDARIAQPLLQIGYLAPSYTLSDDATTPPALDVLAHYLGDGATSHLYRTFVHERRTAVSVGAFYNGSSLDHGGFYFFAYPAEGVTSQELEAEIEAELARVLADGISEDDVERAKRNLIAQTVFAQDSQASLARIFGSSLAVGEDLSDVQQWPSRISAVTADQVIAAARAVIQPHRAVVGLQLPQAPEAPAPADG